MKAENKFKHLKYQAELIQQELDEYKKELLKKTIKIGDIINVVF